MAWLVWSGVVLMVVVTFCRTPAVLVNLASAARGLSS